MTLFNEKKTSNYLGNIPVKTLQRWRLEGKHIPYVKLGKAVRYRQSDLNDYIDNSIRTSTTDNGGIK